MSTNARRVERRNRLFALSRNNANGDDAETDDTVTADETTEQPEVSGRRRRGVTTPTTEDNNGNGVDTLIPMATTYDDFWRSMRRMRILIAGVSAGITLFTIAIFLMWLLRLIPSIPGAFLDYGFIWYIPVFFTAMLGFFISFARNRELYLITTILTFAALLIIVFMCGVTLYQMVLCFDGSGGTTCTSLYFSRTLLLLLSLAIAFLLVVDLYLFTAVIVGYSQIYLQFERQQRRRRN